MKLILAQGNPGAQYATTRHNIGWMLLDAYAAANAAEFKSEKRFAALVATITTNGQKVLLVKPTTFYNETGRTARALIDFYKLDPAADLLVIHDDLALPFGTVRVRNQGSDGGNNGIKSLNAHVGSDYWRIRIGTWAQQRERTHDANFVLDTFTAAEAAVVASDIYPCAKDQLIAFCEGTLTSRSLTLIVNHDEA